MSAKSALELIKLTKRYGDTVAVEAIDQTIPNGTYACLLGPSGCGKSSTLRMIAGHETVSSGDILQNSLNITDLPPARRGTAMMFQSYALFPHLSVVDNVAFSLKMKGVDKKTRQAEARQLLELVDMAPYGDRLPTQLSGGQQQRVALARALDDVPLHITGFHLGPDFSQATVVVDDVELLAGLGLVRFDTRLDLTGGIRPAPGYERDLACKRRCAHQAKAEGG